MITSFMNLLSSFFWFGLIVILSIVLFWLFWFFLHYRSQSTTVNEDLQRLTQLQTRTTHLEARVKVLESILDAYVPNWRTER